MKLGSGRRFSVIIQGLITLSSVKLGSGRRFSVIIQGLLELSSVKLGSGTHLCYYTRTPRIEECEVRIW